MIDDLAATDSLRLQNSFSEISPVMKTLCLDDFADVRFWKPFASGGALISVHQERIRGRNAIRIDFDFQGEQGFVGIRKEMDLPLSESCTFAFRIGGNGPQNTLEFKLTDQSNTNVWRWQQSEFKFRSEGEELELRNSQIDFAWGPDGGARLKRLGGVEFVITAGPGGAGSIWIEDLLMHDRTVRKRPFIFASSTAADREIAQILQKKGGHGWRPEQGDHQPWLLLDFHEPREYGGLVVDWGIHPLQRSFRIFASNDESSWRPIYETRQSSGRRSFISLPGGESRFLRFEFDFAAEILQLTVQSFDFSRSIDALFESMAAQSPRGDYPRYLLRQQSYWTCTGVPDGMSCALINEEGLVEPDLGSFSLEPFLRVHGDLMTWANVRRSLRLEENDLPIPTVRWTAKELKLEVTPFATGHGQDTVVYVRYRLTNTSEKSRLATLFVACRPHQVTPPWQKWENIGGISEILDLNWSGNSLSVNHEKLIIPLTQPDAVGVMSFDEGELVRRLAAEEMPLHTKTHDPRGLASGALQFHLTIPADSTQEIFIAVPVGTHIQPDSKAARRIASTDGADQFQIARLEFEERLNRVIFSLPAGMATTAARTFRTAAGQILINRIGPALQPGPRRYTRCWIRDSAMMGAALLRAGEFHALGENVRWYAQFQEKDGAIPCCVDRHGADELVEHDSHGEFLYSIMETWRFSRDRQFLFDLWPSVRKAALHLISLREQRLTAPYQSGPWEDRHGLLPESASHEGYLAQPVHSYWDDFWGLRGLLDAAAAARELGHTRDGAHFQDQAEELRQSLIQSIQRIIAEKSLAYIPGSVEWADFDPTATANALFLFADHAELPIGPLKAMFQLFIEGVRKRRSGEVTWKNYSAYEIRIIGACVRLGMRAEALELLSYYLSEQRPKEWHQWPEISWRDPRSPGHLGDLPHTWIAGEYMLAFTSLFAYEREEDQSLVLAAGVDWEWLTHRDGISVQNLPTWYGSLKLKMTRGNQEELQLQIDGTMQIPPGGFVLRPPLPGPVDRVIVNGHPVVPSSQAEIQVLEFPAVVQVFCVYSDVNPGQALSK